MKGAGRGWRAPLVVVVVGALFALAGIVAGCGGSGGETPPPSASPGVASERQVIDLVELTRAALEKDTPATLTSINAAQKPSVDPAQPQLYSYVYDMSVTLVASPDPDVSGQSMKGKPDAVGKLFRDEIVAGALDHGSGWVTYVYAARQGRPLPESRLLQAHRGQRRRAVRGLRRALPGAVRGHAVSGRARRCGARPRLGLGGLQVRQPDPRVRGPAEDELCARRRWRLADRRGDVSAAELRAARSGAARRRRAQRPCAAPALAAQPFGAYPQLTTSRRSRTRP